ncbi:MAG: glycine cleavage system aminomethyltransferase GcvT [candidate division WOR-3 bacterium]
MNRTPFYSRHVAHGGRLVEFAGFELPLQFRGILSEHERVRTTVGVFDVSHMGRIEVRGRDATSFVNWMTTNDVSQLAPMQAQYSVFCYPDAGIVDDLVVYRLEDCYLLVVNGANRMKDLSWLKDNRRGDVEIVDLTMQMAQLAVQGPRSEAVMQKLVDCDLSALRFYWATRCKLNGIGVLISRTGYTGEDGFEVYLPAGQGEVVWDAIMAAGKEFEIEPIGLGARDTLRLEMKYCLYGNDIDQTTNPLEAGLGFVTKLDKPNGFVGRDALLRIKAEGVRRRLVGVEFSGHDFPRPGCEILVQGERRGHITSGTMSPSLRRGIGLAYVDVPHATVGTELQVLIRGREAPAKVVATPFYRSGSRK